MPLSPLARRCRVLPLAAVGVRLVVGQDFLPVVKTCLTRSSVQPSWPPISVDVEVVAVEPHVEHVEPPICGQLPSLAEAKGVIPSVFIWSAERHELVPVVGTRPPVREDALR